MQSLRITTTAGSLLHALPPLRSYPPACTNCACTEKGGIAGIQLPAAQTVRSASVSPVRIPDHIGAGTRPPAFSWLGL